MEPSLTHSPWADDLGWVVAAEPELWNLSKRGEIFQRHVQVPTRKRFYSLWSDWTGAAEAVLRCVKIGSLGVFPPPPSSDRNRVQLKSPRGAWLEAQQGLARQTGAND